MTAYSQKDVVLFAYLIEQKLNEEFHKTFNPKNAHNTLVPHPEINASLKKVGSGKHGIHAKSIYWTLAEKYPIIAKLGSEDFFAKICVAANFDVLAFVNFYVSSLYRISMEETYGIKISEDHIWNRHAIQKKSGKASFGLDKSSKPGEPDPYRQKLHFNMTNSFRVAFRSMSECKAALENEPSRAGEEKWWTLLRHSQTFDDLPAVYRKGIVDVVGAIAHLVDHVMDEPERYRRAERLQKKIPVEFLVTSLYVVNPAPFVATALKMFMVGLPKLSLCQMIGSSFVGWSRTKAQRDGLEKMIPADRKKAIIEVVESKKLNGMANPKKIKKALEQSISNVTKEEIGYARFTIRLNEKKDFVNYLGSAGPSSFFDFLGKFLPALIREWAKIGSLPEITQKFFDLLDDCLYSLGRNFEKTSNKEAQKKEIIAELSKHILTFVKWFIPFLAKNAERIGDPKKELPILTFLIDVLLNVVVNVWADVPKTLGPYHDGIKNAISNMSTEDQNAVLKHVDGIVYMSNHGADERFWPFNDTVQDLLTPLASEELSKWTFQLPIWENVVSRIYSTKGLEALL